MKKKSISLMTAVITAVSALSFPSGCISAADDVLKYEFEDGTFADCENNQGIAWEQVDEDAEGNPCDMTGWSGDGFAYVDDKDSSVAVKVKVDKAGLYALKLAYIQCFGRPSKIQWLYVNGESQGEISFPCNSGNGWEELDAGYVYLNEGENEIKIVSYWGYTFFDYLLIDKAPDYITTLSPTHSLCNPNATQSAKNVYDFLLNSYGSHIISGQQEYCGSHCYNKNAYESTGQPINYLEDNEAEFEYIM